MTEVYIDCVGDSLTAGVVSPTYPQILRKKLKESKSMDLEVRNRGKIGFTVAEYASFQLKPVSRKLMAMRQPDFILIMLGTNNTRSSVNTSMMDLREQYIQLIEAFQTTSPKSKLLFGLIPIYYGPVSIRWKGETHLFDAADRIPAQINPMIEELALINNYSVVDCYTPMRSAGPTMLVDGIHPNREGNQLLAETWYQNLADLL